MLLRGTLITRLLDQVHIINAPSVVGIYFQTCLKFLLRFIQLAQLMQRHGLSEQGPILTGAGFKRLVEMRQSLLGLAEMQQTQAAPGVGLPQVLI